jgi:hypothetical protein
LDKENVLERRLRDPWMRQWMLILVMLSWRFGKIVAMW